ncbi:MAG: sulfurtransferase TusA family protein, partial [Wenzhouxiangellaceae bacterium]
MNAINHADEILDALGMQCPEPVVHARNRLAHMAPGRVLEVLVDDPLAELDFTVFCRRAG